MTATAVEPVTPEPGQPRPGSRADRARRPRARDALRETAVEFGVCVRPLPLRRVDTTTGETQILDLPCGSTRATVCPSCAARARRLRAQQCREGWHLTDEPDLTPDPATREHKQLVTERAQITAAVEDAADAGDTLTAAACQESEAVVDDELAAAGLRGRIEHGAKPRRVRSTRRRQDTPDLPRRPAVASTLGRAFTDPKTGTTFRPSLFVTLTLPSYGRVQDDATPVTPWTYDYVREARDALHFGKLLDRWCQNLRRVAGYDVQYFATVEPNGAAHHTRTSPSAAPSRAPWSRSWWPPPTPRSGGRPPGHPSTPTLVSRSGSRTRTTVTVGTSTPTPTNP